MVKTSRPFRFHKPVEGEPGYEPFDEDAAKASMSSLAQIVSSVI